MKGRLTKKDKVLGDWIIKIGTTILTSIAIIVYFQVMK